jgi:hypothetical protein
MILIMMLGQPDRSVRTGRPDRSAWTDQSGQEKEDLTVGTGELGTRAIELNGWDRTSRTGQPRQGSQRRQSG